LKKFFALASVAISLFASSAFAQSVQNPAYIGGAVGATKADIDCGGTTSCDNTSTGGKAYFGYKFTPNFAAEIGYLKVGKATATVDVFVPGVGGFTADGSMKADGWTLGVAGFVPFTQSVEGFARLGAFMNKTKFDVTVRGIPGSVSESENNTSAYFGLGIGFKVTKQLSIDGGLDFTKVKFQGEDANVTMWSIGARYAF
jgi:OOP family OmpA-OmpF porin